MKKIVTILTLLAAVGSWAAQAQGVGVQINGNQSFVLSQTNGIYFHNDSLTIDGVTFALDDITVITFSTSTGIADIEEASMVLAPNPVSTALTVRGIGSEPQTVTLYSTAGIKLLEQKAADGTVINVSHLPEGVYIMRCGDRMAKVVKQL